MKIYKYCFLTLILISHQLFSQPISNWKFANKHKQILYDFGKNWENLSSINSLRYKPKIFTPDMFSLRNSFRVLTSLNDFSVSWSSNINFKKYFYIYFDLGISNFENNEDLGEEKKINYSGLKFSGFGYQNKWVTLQICRGLEQWGSGNGIELALSEDGHPYDYFMLSSDYGNIRVNYIHGFLENKDKALNRYINARGVEWTNKKSVIISITESIIYSGLNRPFEFGYFNPIASHLEVELNDRLTSLNTDGANAVWQLHLDYLVKKGHRLSINFLFDEFILDPDIEIGKEHGKAFSGKYVFSKEIFSKYLVSLYSSFIYVGTPTFRHGDGQNNFVNKNQPLGWKYGSDGTELSVGCYLYKENKIIFDISLGSIQYGEETLIINPYKRYSDYLKGKFPSGDTLNHKIIKNNLRYRFDKKLTIFSFIEFELFHENTNQLEYGLGLEIQI